MDGCACICIYRSPISLVVCVCACVNVCVRCWIGPVVDPKRVVLFCFVSSLLAAIGWSQHKAHQENNQKGNKEKSTTTWKRIVCSASGSSSEVVVNFYCPAQSTFVFVSIFVQSSVMFVFVLIKPVILPWCSNCVQSRDGE